ncbi:MAG TPA: hypothetical protein VK610_10240, partial [Rhodothermales bacterium]|nr:hypothetical protein [Rhodothermales bacterium]
LAGGTTYDYFRASGVVGYHDRFVEVRFGRDRNRWGPGTNSLSLSDYAPAYDQLQIRARVWRLAYTSLVARFTDPRSPTGSDTFLPSAYGAFHRLTLALPYRTELSLYESVIFADDSTGGRRRGFELAYLNPILFYRALEGDLGSPDNVLLGASAAWTPVRGARVYGDLFLDELRVSQLSESWWGNKWAFMLGAHAVVPGVDGLDARVEFARLRPYLYSHRSLSTAYVHYGDGLGHTAGPNAQDLSLFLRYRPTPALHAALDVAYTLRGRNTDSLNYGSDPRVSYDTRVGDFGITQFQGVRQSTWLVEGRVGYEVLPNLLVEAALVGESVNDAELGLYRYTAGFLQLRWGLPFRSERW